MTHMHPRVAGEQLGNRDRLTFALHTNEEVWNKASDITMPLVKIDLIKGVRSPEEIKKVADVVQDVMLSTFNAPPRDRYVQFETSIHP